MEMDLLMDKKSFSKDTGEIVNGTSLELDDDKIQEEERYDEYYLLLHLSICENAL